MSTTASKILTHYLAQQYLLKKINLLHLRHLCFPGKFMNFLEAARGSALLKNLFLKVSQGSCRPATLSKRGSNTGVFLSEYCKIFKNYFEKHLLTAASDFLKQLYRSPVSSCFCIVQIIY